ncbi:hypothetical protein KF840_23835 [bacterium]|nr:hypothetical protein [bacterium]
MTRRVIVGGGIAIALGAIGTTWLARSPWGQRWAAQRVAAALGPSVRFSGAHVAPWPPPLAVALDGVEVLDAAGAPVLRARHVLARVRLRALIGGSPALAQVLVDGFELDLRRGDDGAVRLGDVALANQGDGSGAPAALDRDCPRIELRDGRVTLREGHGGERRALQVEAIAATLTPTRPGARLTFGGRSAQLGELRGDVTVSRLADIATAPFRAELEARGADAAGVAPWLPSAGATLTMSGSGRLSVSVQGRPTDCTAEIALDLRDGAVAWRDRIRAAAPIALTLRGGWSNAGLTTATGQVDIARVQAAGVDATALRASFAVDPAGITLRDAQWQAFGGHWRQHGTVHLADTVALDGGVDAEAIDAAAAAAAVRQLVGDAAAPLQLAGPLTLHATASGQVGAALAGQIAVSMASGSASWATVTATAPLRLIAAATFDGGALTLRDAQAQAAAVSDRDLTADALDARFAFDGQALQIASLTARAFDGDWTLSGTLPLQGAPTISLSAVGINAAHLARAALTGRREESGTAGDVDVTATLRGGSGQIALRLASPTLALGPLLVAQPASAAGTLTWRGTGVQVSKGSAQLARVRFAGTDLGDVRAAFASGDPGHLLVSPLTARAFGGGWRVSADLSRDEIAGRVRATNVNLDAVLAALDAGPRSQRGLASVDATGRRRRDGTVDADLAVELARGRFLFQALTVGAPARGTGTLRVDGPRWALANGVVSAAVASYGAISATQATAQLDFAPDHVRFAALRATAAGAPWQGSGRIDLADPRIEGTLSVTRADPDAFLRLLGIQAPALDPDGLDLTVQLSTPLHDGWRQALQGSGRMALRGGFLTSTGLLRAIVATIVPTRALREGGPPNRLTSLTQTFTLANGRLSTQDLAVDSDDYDLAAAGSIGFDGTLALDGRITLTPNGIKKMFALSAVPIPGSGFLSLPVIPARVDGTLAKPDIHPEAAALAGSTARWFADALIGAPRRLGQTVVQPLDWMFDGVRTLVAPPTPAPSRGP